MKFDKPICFLDLETTGTNVQKDRIFNFGQHKGKKAKTELSYLDWMLNKGDFTQDTKAIAQSLLTVK